MARHFNLQHAPCGCKIYWEFDDDPSLDASTRELIAVDPQHPDVAPLLTPMEGGHRRVACDRHAGADHVEHAANLRRDELASVEA